MKGDFLLGPWLVQPSLCRVSLDGRTVQVRPKVMDLLVYLAGSPGTVISKETLLNDVWGTEAISESALTRTITELRSAVGDDADQPRFLETIPKRGYRLIASVRPVASPERPGTRWRRAPYAIGLGTVLIGGSLALLLLGRDSAHPTETPRVRPLTSSPGLESQPCFSPDGTRVAFVWSGEPGDNFDIYVKRIDEDAILRLTADPAPDQSPAWSPDGLSIAFVRGTNKLGLHIVSSSGGGERFLGNLVRTWSLQAAPPRVRILDWFHDGRTLAVADQNSPEDSFHISPDDREVAFARASAPNAADIHIVPAAGGESRRLTFDFGPVAGLTWSEDGQSIVFSSERAGMAGAGSLWRVPVGKSTRSEPERVPEISSRAIGPSVASRGGRLAYQEYLVDTNIRRASTTGLGSPESVITSTREDTLPDYSPDGGRIAFASNQSGSWEIWSANADGSGSRQLTNQAGAPGQARWSPDGRLLAFTLYHEGNVDIYTMTPEGSGLRRLTTESSGEETPTWSRDGRWLYFASNRSGPFEIWKLAVDRPDQIVQVTHGGGTNPVVSVDGERLFYKKGGNTNLEIWVTVDGGKATRVLGPIEGAHPRAWVPDSHGIYFIEPGWRIVYHHLASSETRPIATLAKDALVGNPGLALSPDGRWLLYGHRDRFASDIMLVENFR
jgi:Tol biopolymer transport system component/DNA-binding winged helix-turn-helix (wHTH) protein